MASLSSMSLEDVLKWPSIQRREALRAAIATRHIYHFERNVAYRQSVAARGIGPRIDPAADLARILRPAALTFKSYADRIGPFPQEDPLGFLHWLSEQLSIPLSADRWSAFPRRFGTLEALLLAVERTYAGLGLEIVTSTGTSGRASIVVRDAATIALAVQAFFAGIQRVWGIGRGTALVFMMPAESRVAMARTARFGVRQTDWEADGRVYFTVPFSATPDQLRVRAGRTFRPGLNGILERRVLHPFMAWANVHVAEPRFRAQTLARLRECGEAGLPTMLLGGLAQLHGLVDGLSLSLPAGSRVATGGGMKEHYPFTPAQIRADLSAAFGGTPVSDVYGMAEANWAAFECDHGNYHMPPWVHAVVTDDDDEIVEEPEAVGRLAFFDPLGGGGLIPPFFQTTDQVHLVNAAAAEPRGIRGSDPALACPCGYDSPYIRGAIRRVDLVEEAGCAAQV